MPCLPLILGGAFTNAPWLHHLSICFPLAHGTESGNINCKMVWQFHSFDTRSESFEVLYITSSALPAPSSQFRSELCSMIPSPTVLCPSTWKSFSFSRLLPRFRKRLFN